jgi:predicted fused transcriptional regulator/phosphomethylpyrimidine kinase/predicted transcriptional regulator
MRPPCEIVQRDFLRAVRAFVARSLKKEGFSQTEIALKMDMTQAAVSKYLSQPLTKTKLAGDIDRLSQKLTEMIKTGESGADQIVREICSACMHLRLGSTLCEMHQDKVPSLKAVNCQVCSQLLGGRDDDLAERAIVIGDILEALRIIEQSESFEVIVPQVRANFVACNDHAETYKDVAGVPGRITIVDGRARALISPQFGASQHTAELLLHAKSTWPRVRACLCVSGREAVLKITLRSGFKVLSMKDPESSASKIVKSLKDTNQLPGPRTSYPAIHIPGGFGIEPILYLFGPSAKELSERSIRLSDAMKS